MRDDPCCRAMFGMTIENTTTRLWFCCRSSIVVSEPFDFFSVRALILTFVRKSFGFDPTIVRVPERPTEFVIDVHDSFDKMKSRRFHSKMILSSYGAGPLRVEALAFLKPSNWTNVA